MSKPKLNLNKLKDRLNRHKNKGSAKQKFNSDVSPFFSLKEGKNLFRLVAWPDAEKDDDGLRVPDFKELWFYYNLEYAEKDAEGKPKMDRWGKPVKHKAPLSNKFFGEDDIVAETLNMLFQETDENGNPKTDEQLASDKELAKLLFPTQTWYLLGIDQSKKDEGLKIWSITSKNVYEQLLTLMLDEKKGRMILDPSEDGHCIEITVTMSDDGKGKKKRNPPSISVEFTEKTPIHEDPEVAKELQNCENFPDPTKIFAKRKLTSEDLEKHFNNWFNATQSEEEINSVGTEHDTDGDDDEVEVEEVKTTKQTKTQTRKSQEKRPTNVDDAFSDLSDDDDDED